MFTDGKLIDPNNLGKLLLVCDNIKVRFHFICVQNFFKNLDCKGKIGHYELNITVSLNLNSNCLDGKLGKV
jgi:hypothetical protein